MNKTLSVQTNQRLKACVNDANTLRRQGKPDEAIKYIENVRPFFDEPKYLRRLLNSLGLARFELAEYERAVESYKEALSVDVLDDEDEMEAVAIRANIANCLVLLDRPDEALNHIDTVIEAFTYYEAWKGQTLETKARALLTAGRVSEAYDASKESVRILETCDEPKALREAMQTQRLCFEAYQKEVNR